VPPGIAAEPLVWECSDPYWRAWRALQRSRPLAVGFGDVVELPIPYGEISRYAHDYGMADPDDLDDLLRVMTKLDEVWLNRPRPKKAGG
jgi:hypothetical protein